MNKNVSDPKFAFEFMIDSYLKTLDDKGGISELEIRFGTKPKISSRDSQNVLKSITKIDFDNTVKHLLNSGFTCDNPNGEYLLRITPDVNRVNEQNQTKRSKTRLELVGIDLIQTYCEKNEDVQEILKLPQIVNSPSPDNLIKFTIKSEAPISGTDKYFEPVDFDDFGFRVSFQLEKNSGAKDPVNNKLLTGWNDLKKTYRYMNRTKFIHPEYPIIADISIIQSSKRGLDFKHIPQKTLKDAGLFNNEKSYEIELEIDNTKASKYTKDELLLVLRRNIRSILSALQQSNYPIGYKEKASVINSYMNLIHGPDQINRAITVKDFIGPNSMTLQMNNIVPIVNDSFIPNIRTNYSVTDKADGKRSLLYISDNGRLYLIDSNMNIVFTGSSTNLETNELKQKFHNSLLDGEFIKHDESDKSINLFAAFDIYYEKKNYVGNLSFETNPRSLTTRYRILETFISNLKLKSVVENSISDHCNFIIKCKDFEFSFDQSIFNACHVIQSKLFSGYKNDGLIFTPTDSGVGGSKMNALKGKITWAESFKWKPPKFNTIDFLVNVKKNIKGQNEIHNICSTATNLQDAGSSIKRYQVLELMCGYAKQKDGELSPMLELVTGEPPKMINDGKYQPVKFYPTNPVDINACYCNIMLDDYDVMKTEDGEFFEGDMIVEFKYDIEKKGVTDDNAWKWIPIRVRYDKTIELREHMKDKRKKANFGNSFEVANSNWTSIHNPIEINMLTSGEKIPTVSTDNTVYYNKSNKQTTTRGLRDFHNLYVKRQLILGVATKIKRATLIDYAVGKAGDLNKWLDADLSFVFGIDVSSDNINNKSNGACVRYLEEKRRNSRNAKFLKILFAVGDSAFNIRDNSAFGKTPGSLDEQISNNIFGVKDTKSALKAVGEQFGSGKDGFDLSSVQFAMHYFFKNKNTVHQFMRNISECTKLHGYFIATCYDGKTIFDKLQKKTNSQVELMEDDSIKPSILILTKDKERKMLEITKLYSQTGFNVDEPCLGYSIDVWQESINKNFIEYLVNFEYVIRLMVAYGFELVPSEEAVSMGLPNSTGLFSDLYNKMTLDITNKYLKESNIRTANKMTEEEKEISFMNRYFVFKKNRNIENTSLIQQLMNETEEDDIPTVKYRKIRKINLKIPNDIIPNIEDTSSITDTEKPITRTIKRKTIKKKI
jgi:hypothetical protein